MLIVILSISKSSQQLKPTQIIDPKIKEAHKIKFKNRLQKHVSPYITIQSLCDLIFFDRTHLSTIPIRTTKTFQKFSDIENFLSSTSNFFKNFLFIFLLILLCQNCFLCIRNSRYSQNRAIKLLRTVRSQILIRS